MRSSNEKFRIYLEISKFSCKFVLQFKKYIVPMDILLKTPQEYAYSKKAYFDSEIII